GYYTWGGVNFGVGVLKTTNGTDPLPTWDFTGLSFNPFINEIAVVQKLLMSPTDHNTIYAYTGKDIFKSTDGGATWPSMELNTAMASNVTFDITDAVLDPLNSLNVILSATLFTQVDDTTTVVTRSLWRWNNTAAQWTDITLNLNSMPTDNAVRLSTTNSKAYALYTSGNTKQIDVSNDGGISWSILTTTNNYGPLFIVSMTNPAIMYTADGKNDQEYRGRKIYKSLDGGSSFIAVSEYWPSTLYHGVSTHGDIRALQLFQGSVDGLNDTLLAGTDGGVLYSTSAEPAPSDTVNWRNVNGIGLAVGQFYGLAGSEKVPGRIIGGAQDNGFATQDNGGWTNEVVGDAYNVVIDHETPSIATGQTIYWGNQYLNAGHYLERSNNGGLSWPSYIPQPNWGNPANAGNNLPGGAAYSPDIWNVLASPIQIDHENNMYLGFHDLFRFNPANNTWLPLSDFTALGVSKGAGCSAFAISPSSPGVMYFGFEQPTWDADNLDKKLWKTTNNGATWVDVTGNLPVEGNGISGIVIDPNNADRLWVSFNWLSNGGILPEPYNGRNRVYYSPDGGATWTDYSKGLTPLPINVITYEQGSNDGLYVGTDVGVFYTNRLLYDSDNIGDPQNTGWVCFRDNLPPCVVTDLEVNYASNRLRASTYGRGIWESSLACPLDEDLYFTSSTATGLSGSFKEAVNDISVVADAGDIQLADFTGRAGNAVHLAATGVSGVHLVPGSHLFIHPCDGPGNSFQPKMLVAGTTNNLEDEESGEAAELQVFPNPSTGKITVKLRDADRDQVSNLRLFDGLGKLMLSQQMTGETTVLDMPFPDGLYTLVATQAGRKFSARVILKKP
ncbi:MAG: T9SS type A sorting domain-containing protein, partial [Flavobacteriales bacterium]|nr:T9SS type A sorting domain-containing protein [Flavobacteriales bacterium]